MEKLRVDDFEIEENDWGYYFTSCIDFLGQKSEVLLNYDTEEEVSESELKNILNKSLEKNKAQLMELLKGGDYINLATKWVKWEEGGIKDDKEENCYLINGTKVYTPITEEDFEKSMNFTEIATDIYLDGEIELLSVSLTFEPDYFVGHCIECYIEEDGSFSING